jgi:hypothetical protein
MGTRNYIRIKEFCSSHEIEESFVYELQEYEVIHLEIREQEHLLHLRELPRLEKMLRLHRELQINPEGLQAVDHLLRKVRDLQDEVKYLRNKLNRFEDL